MPVSYPPLEVVNEFMGPTTRHTRRIEIYEQDGVTRWKGDTQTRLKGGNVTVDYDRDERRALDMTLSNDDGGLQNAPGEMWYDKIIKVYRGVQLNGKKRQPRILVISDYAGTAAHAPSFRAAVLNLDYGDVQVNTLAVNYQLDLSRYDIIVALGTTNKGALLKQAYDAGKSVFVIDKASEYFYDQLIGNQTWGWLGAMAPQTLPVVPSPYLNDPRTLPWKGFALKGTATQVRVPYWNTPNIFGVAFQPDTSAQFAISSFENGAGGRYIAVHYSPTEYQYGEADFQQFLLAAMQWLDTTVSLKFWETQIGEFMVDRISEPNFPYEMKITGRDYTKKCLLAKFTQATQFAAGNTLESVIGAIAIGAGITKRLLPSTGITVGRAFFFERGVSRWAAMKEIATAYSHEIFFDATGYLVIRPFRDPTTSVPAIYIETGKEGQLASYEKSTSDASIFNSILVSGESSDAAVTPKYAIAKNTNLSSPTNIYELGERYWEFVSAFVETTAQAQQLANGYLAVHQLEEFELTFASLMLPWLEVGEIMGWADPNPAPGDPNTFLLSSLTLSLDLGPMSGIGRRVTIVS